MVYSGKVSKACQTCRTRRIKCDLVQPSCTQCTTSNRTCVYRDSFEVVWRDQNRVAERSVQRRRRKAEQQAGPSQQQPRASTTFQLPQKIDDVVLNFYAYSQLLDPEPGMALTHAKILANQLSTAPPDSALVLSAQALTSPVPGEASDLPSIYHRQALVKVQQELNDPVESLTNKTLLAVILLQHYDAMLSFTQGRPPSTTHITGALAVVTHRGELNFADEESMVLLLLVRRDLIYNSIHAQRPIDRVPILFDHPQLQQVDRYPSFELDLIAANIYDLTMATDTFLDNPESFAATPDLDSGALLSAAFELLDGLDAYLDSFPPTWFPVTVSGPSCIPETVSNAGVWDAQTDIYTGIRPCRILNDYRCARLDVLKVILAIQARSLDAEVSASIDLVSIYRMIQHLVDGICLSVPFNMGDRSPLMPVTDLDTVEYPHLEGQEISSEFRALVGSIGGYAILWPLARALRVDDTVPLREGQRDWLSEQLRRVREIFNIRYPHLFEIRHLVC